MILCSLFDRLKAALHLNNLQKKKSSHNRTLYDALCLHLVASSMSIMLV